MRLCLIKTKEILNMDVLNRLFNQNARLTIYSDTNLADRVYTIIDGIKILTKQRGLAFSELLRRVGENNEQVIFEGTKGRKIIVYPKKANPDTVSLKRVRDALENGLIDQKAYNAIVQKPSKPFKNNEIKQA